MEEQYDVYVVKQPKFNPDVKYKIVSREGKTLYEAVNIVTLGERREDAGWHLIDNVRYKIVAVGRDYFVMKTTKGYMYYNGNKISYRKRSKRERMGDDYEKDLHWKITEE